MKNGWIKWSDTDDYRFDLLHLRDVVDESIAHLLKTRRLKKVENVAKLIAEIQEEHDRKVKRWGWTGFVKPAVVTVEDIEARVWDPGARWDWVSSPSASLRSYDWWYDDGLKVFKLIRAAADKSDDVVLSLDNFQCLMKWYAAAKA